MSIPVDRFVQALAKTGIVTPAEAEALLGSLPPEKRAGDADELARDLVRRGKITRFQAAAIYQAKADGLLLGNYLILDKLGAGGMGQVFRARHKRMDRVVAIKVLAKKLLSSPDAVARFQREVKAAARLTHPHIVTAYDADEAGGLHFLVMEYVDGSDLAGIIKQQGPLPVSQAVDYLLQAARGLEHAHGEGVVHRDIKPSNLLLDKKGTLKILDMGLARFSNPLEDPNVPPGADLTQSGSIMGTIDYMAPEQAMDSREADARADIYSLGCTLHYLLIGRPPYSGDTLVKRLTAHQQAPIPLLSTLRPDIPPGLNDLFSRMLAKQPEARFQTMTELIAALEAFRSQPAATRPMPVMAQPVTAQAVAVVPVTPAPSGMQHLDSILLPGIEPGSRRARKSKSKLPLVAAVVVLLLGGAGAGVWMTAGKQPETVAQQESSPAVESEPPANDPPPAATIEPQPAANPTPQPMPEPPPPAAPATAASSTTASSTTGPPASAPQAMPAPVEPPLNAPPQLVAPPVTAPPVAATPVAAPPVALPAAPAPPPAGTSPASSAPPLAEAPPAAVAAAPLPVEQPATAARLPVPSAAAQQESQKLIQELFKDDYAQAKLPEAKVALAEKLLNQAQQSKGDAAEFYTLVHEARDLAVDAAVPSLVERAIAILASRFEVEPLPELAKALDEMAARSHPADAQRAVAEAALARVEEAEAADDFETARALVDAAQAAARKAKDTALSRRAIEVGKSVNAAKQQWEAWQKAKTTLAQTPEDPAANLAVGRYLCFVQGEWGEGLAHLAKGPAGALKDLAVKSLQPPTEAAALADLADQWFAAVEKAKGKDKADLRAGAAYWYTQAEPGLTGLVKTVVEKRLKELGGTVAARASRPGIPLANGVALPQTLDCSLKTHPATLGPDFELKKSWNLAFEFRVPSLDPGAHQLFLWRDERNAQEPFYVRIYGTLLETRLCDVHKDKNNFYALNYKLSPDMAGAWQRYVVHYDGATREVSVLLNNVVVAQGRSHIVPAADQPAKLTIGGVDENRQRFVGQVRNVWLGNTDLSTALDAKSSTASNPPVSARRPVAFQQAATERNVAEWVLSVGGKVKIASPAQPEKSSLEAKAGNQLPTDPFLVYGVELRGIDTVNDKDFTRISELAHLVEFRAIKTPIGDDGLRYVVRQRHLRWLILMDTAVTDAGITLIEGLTNLQELTAGGNENISDAGIVHFRGLTGLRLLWLNGTAVTGAGLKRLQELPNLQSLGLPASTVSEADMSVVAGFRSLGFLNIDGTPGATDRGIVALRVMPMLNELHATGSVITDQGLLTLASFPALKKLYLRGSRITDAGVQKFRQLRPDCEVFR